MTEQEWLNNNKLSLDIWNNKYRYNNESFEDWLNRISNNNPNIKNLIKEKKFLFGGRTLANRGIKNSGSFSNCYSIGYVEDSLTDIMKVANQIALTFKAQGGQGLSLSKIRPKGTLIHNQFESDGIVPFMNIFNSVTESISQGGSRKGALMMSLDIWHKEASDFITIKENLNKINKANLSLEIDNNFMDNVNNDHDIKIVKSYGKNTIEYKVNPKKLFDILCESAWKSAEPGVLFVDQLRNYNMMEYIDEYQIETTNPCGEQPLPKHGACNLCSINVSEYVVNPYTDKAYIDLKELNNDIYDIVEEMDIVLTENANKHALLEQTHMAMRYRNIGIGIMGLADLFIKLGIKYGSSKSVNVAENLMKEIFRSSVFASVKLGESLGSFPGYNSNVWESTIIQNAFSDEEIDKFKQINKLRNCSLLSVAPTGSIGTMLNISTGTEPFFALSYNRRTESMKADTYKVDIDAVKLYKNATGNTNLPDYFVTSAEIPWKERIDVQAALQKFTDTAISSTVNLPKETTVEDVKNLYIYAWKKGLKGVTIYREGSRNPILSTDTNNNINNFNFDNVMPVSRKTLGTTHGQTFCKKCACGTMYITCNKDNNNNFVEVFTHTSKGGICQASLNAMTRGISLSLRSGVKINEIIDQFKGIHCPACANAKAKGHLIDGLSCPDIISKTMLEFTKQHNKDSTNINKCPDCGNELQHEGGCINCSNCGYTKCS